MHSLIGCFLLTEHKSTDGHVDFNEEFNGKIYKKIEVKLSQLFKRVFYVETE